VPRQARIDVPGALHHVMLRGINRGKLFLSMQDYVEFLSRLGKILEGTKTRCFAWALMPNHVHLLMQTGRVPLAKVMQKLLTGYAGWFNRQHRRFGRLYENRYKSVLCDGEQYLLALVRYIHLNPLRAGLVKDLRGLEGYRWCGHGRVLGRADHSWQDVKDVLAAFGTRIGLARQQYRQFVSEGVKEGRRSDLVGGGLLRSAGGMVEYVARRHAGEAILGDERILGDTKFVEKALKASEARETGRSKMRRRWPVLRVLRRAAHVAGIGVEELSSNGKRPAQCKGRALSCYWLVEVLGFTEREVVRLLGISQPAVSRNVVRGRDVAADGSVRLG